MTIERYIGAPQATEFLLFGDNTTQANIADFVYEWVLPGLGINVEGDIHIYNRVLTAGDRISRDGGVLDTNTLNTYWQLVTQVSPVYGIGER